MLKIKLLTLIVLSLASIIFASGVVLAQESEQEEVEELVEEGAVASSDMIESSSVWELVGQAGNIQYPIFTILIIGVFLISLRSYELYKDSMLAGQLRSTLFANLSLEQINAKISSQPDFMLSRIMAKLLNVFQTNKNADYLHDEIANYNSIQKDNFNIFKNRIDFLSDTAGALGLLGTVWGMFIVFSSGALEQEVILAGMGLALMSTLLGLVVSIILNFCSTITEGYFSKHLENVTAKADELRFRLIELSEEESQKGSEQIQGRQDAKQVVKTNNNVPKSESAPAAHKSQKKEPEIKPEVPGPKKIEMLTNLDKVKAGQTVKGIKVLLLNSKEQPLSSYELAVITEGNSKINGNEGKALVKTDSKGIAAFDWQVGQTVGLERAQVVSNDAKFKHVKKEVSVKVVAGEPKTLQLLNNHQAASVGTKINNPIIAVIKDEHGNPVEGEKVHSAVTMGNGILNEGENEIETSTDENGKVFINFELGSKPGFNAVDIKVPEYGLQETFQAVGQEETV